LPPVWTIVCGLIRNPANALHQARELRRMQEAGLVHGVVVSTWIGELERYPEVRQAFADLGAIFVESREPSLILPGHVLHQSQAILLALEHCPAEAWIFKMRPDVVPLSPMFDTILDMRWVAKHEARRKPTVFERPVWAHSGLLLWPMYLNDIVFMASRNDARTLADIDVKDEVLFSEMAAEQFFHLRPFLQRHPLLRTFARVQRGLHDGDANLALARILWDSPLWARTFALYVQELCANYTVGFGDIEVIASWSGLVGFKDFQIEDLISGDRKAPHIARLRKIPVFNASGWAEAVLADGLAPSPANDRIQAALQGRLDGDPDLEALELATQLQAAFPTYRPTAPVICAGTVTYDSGEDRLKLSATHDSNLGQASLPRRAWRRLRRQGLGARPR